ncbi:MAG: cation:proton antiporter [Bacteroidota bacterium]
MTIPIIITICILLILAYIFDVSSSKTKIPSVILLLLLGWVVKQIVVLFQLSIPDLTSILPILGTVGLILIVLEGSLELEFNKSKLPIVIQSSIIALLPMLLLSFGLAWAFHYVGHTGFKNGLANAIPFAIVSSAIAIPSAKNLIARNKEFVTYESSLSDIFGVILFNFITLNDNIGTKSIGIFLIELLIILVVTFIATLGLAYLLSKIKHHVKFAPIILIIILIYAISKVYHLPALIFILLFGLFLGNLDELKQFKFIQKLKPNILNQEVHKFKELTTEIAFLIRALFFLLFGYLIETAELLNSETILWALGITLGIFSIRYLFLKVFKLPISPLLFIAPRGLITILLFLTIPITQTIDIANKSLIIQVIVLTALVMMYGLIKHKNAETVAAT